MKGAFRFPMIKVDGGSNPDPELYCTANGYIPDPANVQPPIPIPPSETDSIIFLCDKRNGGTFGNNWYQITKSNTLESLKVEVFNELGALVYTYTSLNAQLLDITTVINSLTDFFSIKATSINCSITAITNFPRVNNPSIIGMIINTPNIINLKECAYALSNLQAFEIKSTFGYLTTLEYAFWGTGITRISLPLSLPALTKMNVAFQYSKIEILDLSKHSLPLLSNMSSICNSCGYITKLLLPDSMPSLSLIDLAFSITQRSVQIKLPLSLPALTNMSNLIKDSSVEGYIEVPDLLTVSQSLMRVFYNCKNLTKVKFNQGNSALFFQETFYNSPLLEEVEFPRTTAVTVGQNPFNSGNTAVKKVKNPDVGALYFPASSPVLESMTGDCDNGTAYSGFTTSSAGLTTLHTINLPKFKATYFTLGLSTSYYNLITRIDIDWANSPWTGASPQIKIQAALPVAELDRIMTALPAIAGKVIEIGKCPGYNDCDHTIATAKGWLVTGFAKITQGSVSNIARTTATFNGNLIYAGNYAFSNHIVGVCYAVTQNPTISNTKSQIVPTALGAFTANIVSLAANTTYYARAFATNSFGTVYGEQFTFTTLP
jgi:hypothetical protein